MRPVLLARSRVRSMRQTRAAPRPRGSGRAARPGHRRNHAQGRERQRRHEERCRRSQGVGAVKAELKGDIGAVKAELGAVKWVMGLTPTIIPAMAARLFGVVQAPPQFPVGRFAYPLRRPRRGAAILVPAHGDRQTGRGRRWPKRELPPQKTATLENPCRIKFGVTGAARFRAAPGRSATARRRARRLCLPARAATPALPWPGNGAIRRTGRASSRARTKPPPG